MYHEVCSENVFSNLACKSFSLRGKQIFIIKSDGEFYAYLNRCPHQGIPLDWENDQFLDSDQELIECATHGALFDITSGECLSGPCIGSSLTALKLELRSNLLYVKLD